MKLVQILMRTFFDLLYHPFAFMYDLIAAVVSLGRWKDWVMAAIPFIKGPRVLELGFGPGHLLKALVESKFEAIGLDESRQMTRLAQHGLRSNSNQKINLVRGRANFLPFPNQSFNSIVSTFPSEYIFDQSTVKEIYRMILDGGRLVVLPMAWHMGRGILERILAWVFHITGESPGPFDVISRRLMPFFEHAGFHVEIQKVEVKTSLLLVFVATKTK